jgi:hypothetical protein
MRQLIRSPHQFAAVIYGGLGVLVIGITFAAGLVPEGRENAVAELSIGAVFLLIAAVLIYRGWWLVSAVLIFSNTWRTLTYFNDGRGLHMELLPFGVTQTQPQPVAFVNAALMAIIVFMLSRSTWFGLTKWCISRKEPLGK